MMNNSSDENYPSVTIVTPSYNQATFLESAIQSVLAQAYPHMEYFIVDGGSTDGSLEIIQRYADQLSWWVSEPDQGQAEAINKGLARAQGEFVAWLNSDDLYLPGAISEAVRILSADRQLGMVYGDAFTIDVQGRPLNSLMFGDWNIEDLVRFRIICQPAVFMRREALERVGNLDPAYDYMLDHHTWLRIANQWRVRHVASFWAAARHHPMAKNVSQSAGFSREIYELVDWMKSDQQMSELLLGDRRRIMGGAHRLAARYFLDGDLPGQALKAYYQAMVNWPMYAFQHWHRMIYAVLSILGGGWLKGWYDQLASRHAPELRADPQLENWPGLDFR